jgi:fermentation-respiration switch protein FrsA (DUF1100 family)
VVKVWRVLLLALAGYVAYAALVFFAQRSLIFPGQHMRGASEPPRHLEGFVQTWLKTSAGRVEAWFVPARPDATDAAPALLFAHGNYELIDQWPELLAGARELGLSVMLVEYPGYGRSEGSPSERGIAEALAAAHDWLSARDDVDADRIVAFGRSLGSGAVCTLVGKRKLAAIVLQSPFTSISQFARARMLPAFLVRDPFDNEAALRKYDGPVLVLHGEHDDVVPYAHGQRLARVADNARLVTYSCAHNDCPPDWDVMWNDVRGFLSEHQVLTAPDP